MDYAAEIKSRLTLPEIVRYYGFRLNRHNRMPCPFHQGNDNNLGVKDDFYHCFVCGCKGDQISFVQDYFGLSFQSAIQKINEDFSLGLPIGKKMSLRQRLEAEKESFELSQKIKREREARNFRLQAYYDALGKFICLDRQKRLYAPKSGDAELNPLFIDALQNFELAKYRLECAETELFLHDQSKHTG